LFFFVFENYLHSGYEANKSNCLAKPVSTTGASGLRPIIKEQTTRISFLKKLNQLIKN
jgi:hypothetical protein